MRDPIERVRDMLDAISAIERYLDRGHDEFEKDELLQGWFVLNLQILGEAAKGLPESVRALAPEIPWHKIVGMRNVLVHGYFEIDTEIVWRTAIQEMPALRPSLERLLERIEGEENQ